MIRRGLFTLLLLSALGVVASPSASAQSIIRNPGQHRTQLELELHGIARWYGRNAYGGGAVGVGGRVGIPIVRNGFIPRLNNSVAINFGADITFWPGYFGYLSVVAPVALQWNFYLTGQWSVFGEAAVALEFFPGAAIPDRRPFPGWLDVWPGLAVGARYHFGGGTRFPTLTLRAGFPSGLNVGVSF